MLTNNGAIKADKIRLFRGGQALFPEDYPQSRELELFNWRQGEKVRDVSAEELYRVEESAVSAEGIDCMVCPRR